jgi:hypothetical protein
LRIVDKGRIRPALEGISAADVARRWRQVAAAAE